MAVESLERRDLLSGGLGHAMGGSFSPADERVRASWTWVGPQSIPDGPVGDWVQIDFQAQAEIPPGALVTDVKLYHEITHARSGDVEVQVSNASHTWTVRDNQGGATANIDEIVIEQSIFAGDVAAQAWFYRVRDTRENHNGTLDVVQVFVFYEEASADGEIHGSVWDDQNGDGQRDGNEPGLADRRVFLDENENGHWAPGEPSELTDALGDYAFTGLAPGDYVVRCYGQERWGPTYPDPVFGNRGRPAEAGTAMAWYDSLTGEFTVSATGVQGWALVGAGLFRDDIDLYVTQNSDLPTKPSGTFVSKNVNIVGEDSFGDSLSFDGVHLGAILDPALSSSEAEAAVRSGEVFLDYRPFVGPSVSGEIVVGPTDVRHEVTIAPQQIVTGVDFGSQALSSEIHGSVWNDLDGDAHRDGGEPGLGGWKVYIDENRSGSWDPTEPFELTDANGHYAFADVTPGTYLVGEVVHPPWLAGSPPNASREVVVDPHEVVFGVDFANRLPTVAGRHVFYNNSAFDGNDPGADESDDRAIATDKTALRGGGVAGFDNYTSYSRGINGVMVDVAHPAVTPTAADFLIHVGNGDDPADFTPVSTPVTVDVREGAGVDASDRVTLTWPDNTIRNAWLQVTVLADGLGMAEDDVFYFGNAVGEAGDSTANTRVTTTDVLLARNHPRAFLNPAPILFGYDYNRDQRVNATDVLLARNNVTNFLTALTILDLSGSEEETAAQPDPPQGGRLG